MTGGSGGHRREGRVLRDHVIHGEWQEVADDDRCLLQASLLGTGMRSMIQTAGEGRASSDSALKATPQVSFAQTTKRGH